MQHIKDRLINIAYETSDILYDQEKEIDTLNNKIGELDV